MADEFQGFFLNDISVDFIKNSVILAFIKAKRGLRLFLFIQKNNSKTLIINYIS